MFLRDEQLDSTEATVEAPARPAPGRRTLSERLPVQRKGLPGSPTPVVAASPPPAHDDPFGLHLLATPVVQRRVTAAPAEADTDHVHRAAAAGTAGSAGPLPFLDQIQSAFGSHDVSSVRAYSDAAAAAGAQAMGAEAFAIGDQVAFAGAPSLHTAAHEAAHVIQQRAGVALKDGVGATGDRYEQHADAVADRVVRGESVEGLLDEMAGAGATAGAVQRRIVNNGDGEEITDYDLDALTYHEAVFLDEQINQLRVWSADPGDLVKIAAALQGGPPSYGSSSGGSGKGTKGSGKKQEKEKEKAFEPSTAQKLKASKVQPYLDLIDHLAGEVTSDGLTGGHLLSEMKKTHPNLKIAGVPSADTPWEGWWTDGTAEPKWSSFFPASWTKTDLERELWSSSECKGGRALGNLTVTKSGNTFYPWVNKTLAKPKLSAMKPPP